MENNIELQLIGQNKIENALAAIAAAEYDGPNADQIACGLAQAKITGMRNEVVQAGCLTLINDVYKSNPSSAVAALDTLFALDTDR
jgi:UDP-N-acetylmuramoyl-tripeptide--D-alanyl-D-alanine ligase